MWKIGEPEEIARLGKSERTAKPEETVKPEKLGNGRKRKNAKSAGDVGSILNPKNLQKEVHAFGYDFSFKTYLLTVLTVLLLIAVVGIFFKLQAAYVAAIGIVALLLLPVVVMNVYRRMYEQKRFSDVCDYMEQILYAFQKERKILASLEECREVFSDGMMKQGVTEAIAYIKAGQIKTDAGIFAEAFQQIEKRYPCEKLHTVHELLVNAEERGGDVENSIRLLIEDIEVWKRQVYSLQKSKKTCHTECILSIIAAAVVCGIDMYVMESVKNMMQTSKDVSVFSVTPVQLTSFFFVLICFFAFYKSSKKMTDDWLSKKVENEEQLIKSYEYVASYDENKEQVKSVMLSLPFFAGAVLSYFFVAPAVSIICIVIAVFLLFQHKFSYNMMKKEVKEALYQAFSEWMMDMSLLLQTNNVQVAIIKSIPRAERIMQSELLTLAERIKMNPGDIRSYAAFCETYDIPEISTCMKMLYSISESGGGDVQKQIENLIMHVHALEEKEAELRNENISFKMRSISFYPVVGTSAKLFIDMTMGTLLLLQMFQTAF